MFQTNGGASSKVWTEPGSLLTYLNKSKETNIARVTGYKRGRAVNLKARSEDFPRMSEPWWDIV